MEFLLDPNVAYVLLVTGLLLGGLALVAPGTGALELGALFLLLLAGYGIYNLSFNWWAILILAFSVVPFVYAMRNIRRPLMLALTILGVVLGSIFMFPGREGAWIGVNPIVAIVTSLLAGIFLWIGLNKSIEAHHHHPDHDLGLLIGQLGEAKTDIFADGSAQVAGELWSAKSAERITEGSAVRVIAREGFTLIVEKAS